MAGNTTWRMDDLDGGLSTDLFNLSGLGNDLTTDPGAYNMSDVLNLPIFKENSSVFEDLQGQPLANGNTPTQSIVGNSVNHVKEEAVPMMACSQAADPNKDAALASFCFILNAPTAPGKKVNEDTLTYLNQGQSYPVEMKYLGDLTRFKGSLLKSVVKLTFYERKLQVLEPEKFDEWRNNRPLERLFEIDVPMSTGIQEIRSKGNLSSCYEFDWDPEKEAKLYTIINCVSSEFTKGKSGGESGVPLQIQIDTWMKDAPIDDYPINCKFCQIKVFKSKGADRKHKMEMQKLENKSHDEIGQLQLSNDFTLLKEQPVEKKEKLTWTTPKQGSPRSVGAESPGSSVGTPVNGRLLATPIPMSPPTTTVVSPELTSVSTVEETRAWLQANRFHNYVSMFVSYTGADLLRLTRQDVIQILGPADGIRLHNALQSRAARPLLTIYICLESAQQDCGMKEYHAMFLEALNVSHLRKKLAIKCTIAEDHIVAIYRQGPTGIYVLVDDEMVRNFMDEAHFVVQLLREGETNTYRLILK